VGTMPHPAWALVCLAVLLIGVTKSGFGAGVGLIIVPMTALAMAMIPGQGEAAALGLLLPLLVIGDLIAIGQYRKLLDARLLKLLAVPTLVGVVVGAGLLWGIHYIGGHSAELARALIRAEIGLECVILVGLHYYGVTRGVERKLLPEPGRSWLSGTYAGVSSTLAHAAGPVIALYLMPLKLPREVFVGTCAAYFFALNAAKFPAYIAAGQFAHLAWSTLAALLPLVFAGALVGRWMIRRINDKVFGHIVYSSTMLVGVYLVIDAGVRLYRLWGAR
jgi:uncharacterized protein